MLIDGAARSARARFQSGLLAWLRQPDDADGLREMIAVLRELAHGGPAGGFVWRSAEAFLASLLDGRMKSDDGTRQLCRRIERHLSTRLRGEAGADSELDEALFAYLSGRSDKVTPAAAAPPPDLAGLHRAMGNSLARTAEILPLFAGAQRPRHSAASVDAWLSAAKALDAAWQALLRGQAADCRAQATALVAAALLVNTPACLQLAEALASACARAEETAAREHPALRAALAAALEIAADRDGPNHAHFDQRAATVTRRLDRAETELT